MDKKVNSPSPAFFGEELGEAFAQVVCPAGLGLDADLYGFHRAEGDVGEELCRGGGGQVQGGSVQESILLSNHVAVHVLEDLRTRK